MPQSNNVCPDGDVVDRPNMQMIGRVTTNNAGDERPSAKQTTGEGCQLVCSLGIGLVLGGDQLVGRVFGIVGR